MSQSRYRSKPQGAPAQLPPKAQEQPLSLDDLAVVVERDRLFAHAVRQLYEKRGGLDKELSIAAARDVVKNAMSCRKADALALEQNQAATRPKGEKPYVTVSEERLFIRELNRLNQERNQLEQDVREELMRAIERVGPATLAEYSSVLDGVVGETSEATRKLIMAEVEAEAVEKMSGTERASMEQAAQEVVASLDEARRTRLVEAMRKGDYAAVAQIVSELAPEKRKVMEQALLQAA